jgi:hypothetical protein
METQKEVLMKLCDGYSIQSRTANRFWLVMIVASIISLTGQPNDDNLISLPFTLGTVNISDFYSISIIIISVTSIAYSSAQIQGLRARDLIRIVIKDFDKDSKWLSKNMHVKDFVDCSLNPTFNRVAPISQFLQGKVQFLNKTEPQNKLLKTTGAVLYFIMKIISLLFIFVIPVYSIKRCWEELSTSPATNSIDIPNSILFTIMGLATFSLVILIYGELKYSIRAFKRIVLPSSKQE